jgi:hypothetical protein
MATTALRRTVGVLSALLLAALLVGGTSGTARAADGFKYWNYFHVENGKYAFAQTGPSGFKPADGAVEAYRYGVSSTAAGLTPRVAATRYTVDDICKNVDADAGQKRVGVLLDYGTPSDAAAGDTPPEPEAKCAVVPIAANGQQVLDAVTDLRVENQLVCGIDSYPVKGCSVTVKNAPPPATEQSLAFQLPPAATADGQSGAATSSTASEDDGGVPWPLVGVVAALVVIGGAALALTRRTKAA